MKILNASIVIVIVPNIGGMMNISKGRQSSLWKSIVSGILLVFLHGYVHHGLPNSAAWDSRSQHCMIEIHIYIFMKNFIGDGMLLYIIDSYNTFIFTPTWHLL